MYATNRNIKSKQAPSLPTRIVRKLKLAAAVAAVSLGFVSASQAAVDVTGISTTLIVNPLDASSHSNVSGYAPAIPGPFQENFAGSQLRVDSITSSLGTYNATGTATAVVRRFKGPNTDILWYRGTGNATSSTLFMDSVEAQSFNQAFNANNLLVGTDNLFSNKGDIAGDNTNVERLDMIFTASVTSHVSNAFAVFDRGDHNDHDAFKVAAITGYDSITGKPTSYGQALTYTYGTWGNTDLTGKLHYIVMRRNNDIPGDLYHPAAFRDQSMGATLIPLTDLVPDGTPIYGYSLFAADVDSSNPANLVDWKGPAFPSDTLNTNNLGGLDAIGTAAVLYSNGSSVPEPTSLGLMGASAGLLLSRRRDRKA